MFSYRNLFRQAWDISWRHKYLWFFGVFAALAAGSGSWEYQIVSRNFNQGIVDGSYVRLYDILVLGEASRSFFLGLINIFSYDIWTILSLLSIVILSAVFLIFFIWLAITSQAALVSDSKKLLEAKKKEPVLSIRSGLTEGHRYFWPLLGLNFLIRVLVAAVMFLVSLPLLFMVIKDTSLLAIIYTVLFIIFIPLAMGLSLMVKYSIAYEVLDKHSLVSSLEHGWRLFKKHWLISVEAAIILFLINFVASMVLVTLLAIFLLPLLLLGLIFQLIWLVALTVFLLIAIIVFFGALMTSFQTAAWTNLFLQLKNGSGLAKLERIFSRRS